MDNWKHKHVLLLLYLFQILDKLQNGPIAAIAFKLFMFLHSTKITQECNEKRC